MNKELLERLTEKDIKDWQRSAASKRNFNILMFELISHADSLNIKKLKATFPEHVEAYQHHINHYKT